MAPKAITRSARPIAAITAGFKQQGKDLPGGARSYVVNGHMIGGFALVAFPAKYGGPRVMTLLVNQDGVIYEKSLGPNTAAIARGMTTFSPDAIWNPHQ